MSSNGVNYYSSVLVSSAHYQQRRTHARMRNHHSQTHFFFSFYFTFLFANLSLFGLLGRRPRSHWKNFKLELSQTYTEYIYTIGVLCTQQRLVLLLLLLMYPYVHTIGRQHNNNNIMASSPSKLFFFLQVKQHLLVFLRNKKFLACSSIFFSFFQTS